MQRQTRPKYNRIESTDNLMKILTDYLRNTKCVIQVLLDEQDDGTLEAVQSAVLAGASLRLESTFHPVDTVPLIVLALLLPDGTRQAVTKFTFTKPGAH